MLLLPPCEDGTLETLSMLSWHFSSELRCKPMARPLNQNWPHLPPSLPTLLHLRCPQRVQVADVQRGVLQATGRQSGALLQGGRGSRGSWIGESGSQCCRAATVSEPASGRSWQECSSWLQHSTLSCLLNLTAALAMHGREGARRLPLQAAVWGGVRQAQRSAAPAIGSTLAENGGEAGAMLGFLEPCTGNKQMGAQEHGQGYQDAALPALDHSHWAAALSLLCPQAHVCWAAHRKQALEAEAAQGGRGAGRGVHGLVGAAAAGGCWGRQTNNHIPSRCGCPSALAANLS